MREFDPDNISNDSEDMADQAGELLLQKLSERRRSLWSWFLDTSIFFSFDRSGLLRHQKEAFALPPAKPHEHILITGANSGLGFAAAAQLLETGTTVSLLCRDRVRGEAAQRALLTQTGKAPRLFIADLSDLKELHRAADDLIDQINQGDLPPITCLLHNAGFVPETLQRTEAGHERSVSVHLIGPTLLTSKLLSVMPRGSRVILLSSGGMYFAPLDLSQLASPPEGDRFNGVFMYALTKRAQVELASLMHARLRSRGIDVQSAHPGWADTPGVQRYLETFHRWMGGRLRSSAEGAEAVSWLCRLPPLSVSLFWFDWAPRSPYLLGKKPTPAALDALWAMVCDGAGLSADWTN